MIDPGRSDDAGRTGAVGPIRAAGRSSEVGAGGDAGRGNDAGRSGAAGRSSAAGQSGEIGAGGEVGAGGEAGRAALADLAAGLRAEGGLLAAAVVAHDGPAEHGAIGARRGPEYALVLEAIREGYLQHYGSGRVVRPDDPDLALLAGDRLYALGLARLAALGDVEAVAVLADLISRCAQAHAEGDPAQADAAWRSGAAAIAAG